MRGAFFAALAAVALSALPYVARAADAQASPYAPPTLRLPDGARPLHYEVTLTVVPGEAKASGEIAIDIHLARAHPILWLNGDDLDVSRASVDAGASAVTILSGHDQFIGFAFDPALSAGRHRLTVHFEAQQTRNSTRGIFALQQGTEWYAMTQFEALSARRAFPCFDEPGFKVPWQLSLRVPRNLTAIANTPAISETDIGGGMKAVRFAETRPLPSYLIAFAVGPWTTVNVGRAGLGPTPMRIVAPAGRGIETAFVGHTYPQIFQHIENWFGIPHPYPKLDQVAIPLTVGFAMENVGLITYGAPTILAKPGAASAVFRHRAAAVGAHEMAHQWFGNLVTMA